MLFGVGAAAVLIVCTLLMHGSPRTPPFPTGPTAERMTISVSSVTPDTPKAVNTPR
jgi:hypothetical protein